MTRFDDIGFFWEDIPVDRKNRIAAVMPPIPDTGWKPPTEFPNISNAKVISLDLETYDPELLTRGPGWARGAGHIVGVSICVDKNSKWYFPIRHEIEKEDNLEPEKVLAWLKDVLSNPKQPKIGANIMYDIGWLQQEGVKVVGPIFDVQYAEALLEESAKVSLEVLGQKYLDEGKESNLLYKWCSDYYLGAVNSNQRKNMYRTPPRLCGPYAESDADLPLRIIEKQWPLLVKDGLLDIFLMECEMIPLYIEMRFAGVTVNIPYAEKLCEDLREKEKGFQSRLEKLVGFGVNVNAGDSLRKAFDKLDVGYPLTAKGNPSFVKDFLEGLDHPLGRLITEVRSHQKLRSTFVESYILNSQINGKIYGQFHPLRGEKGGTRSGRYSSSTPNLQNIPSRNPILAPLIRGLFIPDLGHIAWRKYDYSQIEYRFLLHYAVGQAGHDVRDLFNANPDLDYHNLTQQIVLGKTGLDVGRKAIKRINFGLIYGMGKKALCESLKITRKKGNELFGAYFEALPFTKETMDATMLEAQRTGVIKTILGRRSRFDTWEPAEWTEGARPLSLEKALMVYGNIQRAQTHKALNRKLQGSAADLLKKAMHKCYVDGIFDVTGVPRLTVHDELDFSDPGGKDEAFLEMKNIMENAISLSIPVKADLEIGPDWGHVG